MFSIITSVQFTFVLYRIHIHIHGIKTIPFSYVQYPVHQFNSLSSCTGSTVTSPNHSFLHMFSTVSSTSVQFAFVLYRIHCKISKPFLFAHVQYPVHQFNSPSSCTGSTYTVQIHEIKIIHMFSIPVQVHFVLYSTVLDMTMEEIPGESGYISPFL
jgi:hypothetical protein